MPLSECSHSLGGAQGSGDVVLALEDGLVLSHLLLDHIQEEGVLLTLGVAFHGGPPGFYSSTLPTSQMIPLADLSSSASSTLRTRPTVHASTSGGNNSQVCGLLVFSVARHVSAPLPV